MRYDPSSFHEAAHTLYDLLAKLVWGGNPKKERRLRELKSVWSALDQLVNEVNDAYERVIAHPRLNTSAYEIDQIKLEIEKEIDRVRFGTGITEEIAQYLEEDRRESK